MNKTELEAALTWLRTFNNNHSNTILARLLELEVEAKVLHKWAEYSAQQSKDIITTFSNPTK